MSLEQEHSPASAIPPVIMPIMGLIFGLLAWMIDAIIDVYMLDDEQGLISNILMPDEPTEMWMRTLVVAVFLIMGFFFTIYYVEAY